MALSLVRQGIETESLIGSEDTQVLLRAEAMVSGAGREAVKILMADAYLALGAVEVQADRVVLDAPFMRRRHTAWAMRHLFALLQPRRRSTTRWIWMARWRK